MEQKKAETKSQTGNSFFVDIWMCECNIYENRICTIATMNLWFNCLLLPHMLPVQYWAVCLSCVLTQHEHYPQAVLFAPFKKIQERVVNLVFWGITGRYKTFERGSRLGVWMYLPSLSGGKYIMNNKIHKTGRKEAVKAQRENGLVRIAHFQKRK